MKIRENVYKGLRPTATADTELVSYDANEDGSLTVRKYNFPGCSDFPRAGASKQTNLLCSCGVETSVCGSCDGLIAF